MRNVLLKTEVEDCQMQMSEDCDWSSSKGWRYWYNEGLHGRKVWKDKDLKKEEWNKHSSGSEKGKKDGYGEAGMCRWLILTSKGVERVTVGELRLRGRRTWGSWRWLLEAVEEEEGVDVGTRAEAPPDAAAEVLAPSSVSC